MSPGYAKVPNSWSHILFLTVAYVCSCKCLLNSQFFLYTTVVVLMTLFLIYWYNPSEKLHPLVGWITKQSCKRDFCLLSCGSLSMGRWSQASRWGQEKSQDRSTHFTTSSVPFATTMVASAFDQGPKRTEIYSPYYPSSTTPLSKDSQMVFSLVNTNQTF